MKAKNKFLFTTLSIIACSTSYATVNSVKNDNYPANQLGFKDGNRQQTGKYFICPPLDDIKLIKTTKSGMPYQYLQATVEIKSPSFLQENKKFILTSANWDYNIEDLNSLWGVDFDYDQDTAGATFTAGVTCTYNYGVDDDRVDLHTSFKDHDLGKPLYDENGKVILDHTKSPAMVKALIGAWETNPRSTSWYCLNPSSAEDCKVQLFE